MLARASRPSDPPLSSTGHRRTFPCGSSRKHKRFVGWGHEAFSDPPSHCAAQLRAPAGPRAHRAARGHPRKMLLGGCTEKSVLSALHHAGQLRQGSPHKVVTQGAALKPKGELCLVPDARPGTEHAVSSAPAKRPWAGPVQGREKKGALDGEAFFIALRAVSDCIVGSSR